MSLHTAPNTRQRLHLLMVLLLLLGLCIVQVVDAGSKKGAEQGSINDDNNNDNAVPQVHWLVERIGKEIFAIVKRPKYKFYIFMTIGTLPEEQSTIALVNTLCNVLYGILVWLGFLWLPRTFMLFATLLTLSIGPALVLILLGTIGLMLLSCALYPVTSVACLWVFFFSTSHVAQAIGRNMGLDGNRDDTVDFLDVLHVISESKWGAALGLRTIYNVLKEANRCHIREIHCRLDQIHGMMTREIRNRGVALGTTSDDPINSVSDGVCEINVACKHCRWDQIHGMMTREIRNRDVALGTTSDDPIDNVSDGVCGINGATEAPSETIKKS